MRMQDQYNDYLMHHGIKGQRWGNRRFQNEDGSYTDAGRARRRVNHVGGPIGFVKNTVATASMFSQSKGSPFADNNRRKYLTKKSYNRKVKKYEKRGLDINNEQHRIDAHKYGFKTASKINKKVNSGVSHTRAETIEKGKRKTRKLLLTAAILGTGYAYLKNNPEVVMRGSVKVMEHILNTKAKQNGM